MQKLRIESLHNGLVAYLDGDTVGKYFPTIEAAFEEIRGLVPNTKAHERDKIAEVAEREGMLNNGDN